ncbi:hypothetical protein B0H13DRAFT_1872737 [Mycena leptocephala]|nr:hypothetical protein B0H13DRAFT_1872737 [Mycena leptocephala]
MESRLNALKRQEGCTVQILEFREAEGILIDHPSVDADAPWVVRIDLSGDAQFLEVQTTTDVLGVERGNVRMVGRRNARACTHSARWKCRVTLRAHDFTVYRVVENVLCRKKTKSVATDWVGLSAWPTSGMKENSPTLAPSSPRPHHGLLTLTQQLTPSKSPRNVCRVLNEFDSTESERQRQLCDILAILPDDVKPKVCVTDARGSEIRHTRDWAKRTQVTVRLYIRVGGGSANYDLINDALHERKQS